MKNIGGDVFGRIYEFFLMKFSMSGAGAQEGGEFFTPPSLVQLIVNFIEPDHGIVYDPACGSGGMFVQTGHFIKSKTHRQVNEAITVYGTELKSNNVRLAKMNLAIHGIEGRISEENTFYGNPHDLRGKCDFVMANPPFNVKKIDKGRDYVKKDPRLPLGLPRADNGNYLWIQYFHSYLNEKGRAGFVMASSATDAGNTEKAIREKLVETGDVDVIVSVANNFFYTLSLPCHLWFFDKAKEKKNKEKILMIDARNTYRVVSSTINDFSDGQLLNLTSIVRLYRGNAKALDIAENEHKSALRARFEILNKHYETLAKDLKKLGKSEGDAWDLSSPGEHFGALFDDPDGSKSAGDAGHFRGFFDLADIAFKDFENPEQAREIFDSFENPAPTVSELIKAIEAEIANIAEQGGKKKIAKKTVNAKTKPFKDKLNKLNKPLKTYQKETAEFLKDLRQGIRDWEKLSEWFPENKYADVEGLCKITDLEEVRENDYSLTPGRYVGYSIQIDKDFDYKARMKEIHGELAELNTEANELMERIQGVGL